MNGPVIEHLYVHIPFCPRVCPYCNFFVQPADRRLSAPLVDALITQHRWWRDHSDLRPRTLYLGGGTPSALDTRSLERLMRALLEQVEPEEVTLEVNPTTVSLEKALLLRDLGVNRISLGAQSFQAEELRTLGRQHTPERITATYELLRHAGFRNINIDLIFGTPGGSEQHWAQTLQHTLALRPEHISAYCLTYEEDTPFFERVASGQWAHPDPEREARLFRQAQQVLTAAGYGQYEVSNYARPGYHCRHNSAYWRGQDYLGLGPGAVSTLSGWRWKNIPHVEIYTATWSHASPLTTLQSVTLAPGLALAGSVVDLEALDAQTLRRERLMLGIRTAEGIVCERDLTPLLARLADVGLIHIDRQRAYPTLEGFLQADAIAQELFQAVDACIQKDI